MESTKSKIDKLLGIEDGQSIDDVLDDMSLDVEKISQTAQQIDDTIKSDLQKVDEGLGLVNSNGMTDSILVLSDIDKSMKEVEDLIQLSKDMFKHIYESVVSSELIDSELIGSVSKLLESIHVNIAEFISMYRDKQRFIEKIKLMAYQQQQKIELMDHKHKLDLEKMELKRSQEDGVPAGAVDVEGGMSGIDQESIVKMLSQIETEMTGNLIETDEMTAPPGIPDDNLNTTAEEVRDQEQ